MQTKSCFKCGEIKPLGDFYRHAQMADGYLNKCKVCTKLDARRNYDLRHEYYQEYHAERGKQPEVKERHRKLLKQDGVRHPDHYKARHAVQNAIRDGRMERATACELCGGTNGIHAHHVDYSRPFDVQWLCRSCHGKTHRKPRIREAFI